MSEPHDVVASRAQREAMAAAVARTGPTAERYASALEPYAGAVAGQPATPRQPPPPVTFPPLTVGDVMNMTPPAITTTASASLSDVAQQMARARVRSR